MLVSFPEMVLGSLCCEPLISQTNCCLSRQGGWQVEEPDVVVMVLLDYMWLLGWLEVQPNL